MDLTCGLCQYACNKNKLVIIIIIITNIIIVLAASHVLRLQVQVQPLQQLRVFLSF